MYIYIHERVHMSSTIHIQFIIGTLALLQYYALEHGSRIVLPNNISSFKKVRRRKGKLLKVVRSNTYDMNATLSVITLYFVLV